MRLSSAALAAAIHTVALAQDPPPKRGLVFVPNSASPEDDNIWVRPGSVLSWYYNYQSTPSAAFDNAPQDQFEFVPMIWGATDDTAFLDSVQDQLDSGRDIRHVLGFNEPDSPYGGGSGIAPSVAADVWLRNVHPLAARGVRLGLPACTGGPGGIPWLQQFLGNCSELLSRDGERRNCTYDFVTIHWYGNFEGLASHMGSYAAEFPNVPQWITEYNFDHQDLAATQSFYNTSAEYLDRMDSVARYSLFGSFRSEVSNVGPNAAMLNNDGRLTDIGSWYLGLGATGVDPKSAAPSARIGRTPLIGVAVLALITCVAVL
ncbi:glycoside hydrolase family 128 protein [Durotheca rogersii]|uniref:glycoside hydrolase family 128 protein n=1 Tax=Durotheca rogersii TaxID=419775 RepID=UPI00221E79B8|nr:glycoside hydrolase family 128 protein [Durotheca rogersii]KAI5856775.1 glycoside hydrolase family 128 protein [Durotheca rogersii]